MSHVLTHQPPPIRRRTLLGTALAAGSTLRAAKAQPALQKIRVGLPAHAIIPVHVDLALPEALGYYAAESLTCELVPLGSYATAFATMNSGRLEFSLNISSFELPVLAKNQLRDDINFMETTYPFRYAIAVGPGSPVKTILDLKGKRIGDDGPGFAVRTMGRSVVQFAGLDPDADVSWIGVGNGVTGGIALQRGQVDALFYADDGFALLDAAGIKLTHLPMPPGFPELGGIYLATTRALLQEHRGWAVGLGRGVAKAHVFITENPVAAAYLFGHMFPEVLPKGGSMRQQLDALLVPIKRRLQFYRPNDPGIPKAGYSNDRQWQDEIAFAKLQGQLPPLSSIYTNDLAAEINDFDVEQVKAKARAYKLPD